MLKETLPKDKQEKQHVSVPEPWVILMAQCRYDEIVVGPPGKQVSLQKADFGIIVIFIDFAVILLYIYFIYFLDNRQ